MNEVEVLDLGQSSTPMFYFGIKKIKADFGIMITASHLSKDNNGFKVFDSELNAISGEVFKKYQSIFKKKIISTLFKGLWKKSNLFNDYILFLLKISSFSKKELNFLKKVKIAVKDSGGVIKPIFKKLIPKLKLNIRIKKINHSDSFGVVFDADGDRMSLVDKNNKEVLSDVVGSFLTEYFLKNKGKGVIITDERSTKLIKEIVDKYRAKLVYCQVGHSYFKVKMSKEKALLGIEKASHYYFKDFFYADAGVYAFLSFLKALVYYQYTLEDVLIKYKKYANLSEQNFKVQNKKKSIKTVEKYFQKGAENISYLDGLTIEFKNWRFNLRPSNTEEFLRLNIEADDEKVLKEKFIELKKKIK